MPYIKESVKQSDILAVREYYTKLYKRKSKRRLTRLIAKNFDVQDIKRAPLILRFYRLLYKTPVQDRQKEN